MNWPNHVEKILSKLDIALPIIQAPMAGGFTTPELIAAVSNAGGLGSIGAALLTPESLCEIIQATRALTSKSFSVNLFAPLKYERSEEKIQKINEIMAVYRQELNISPSITADIKQPISFEEQLEAVLSEKIKIISFTFGTPGSEILRKLKNHQIIVIGTATTVKEAILLEKLGYDIIVAQGSEAGGHRGTFLDSFENSMIGTMALVPQMVDAVNIPVIAAGGIMDSRGLEAAIILGACAVQMGTAFLTCPEAGTHPKHKAAILEGTEEHTKITSVFSGRPARGIRNRFMDEMEKYQNSLPDYPLQQSLTSSIRKKAAELNREEFLALWAGQGIRLSQSKPAAQLLLELMSRLTIFNKTNNK